MFDQMCGIELGDDPGIAAAMAALSSGASPEAVAAAAAAAAAAGISSNGSGSRSGSVQIPGPVKVECRRKVRKSATYELPLPSSTAHLYLAVAGGHILPFV